MYDMPASGILSRWSLLSGARLRPFGTGLINRTLLAEGPQGRFVLQRLHPVFAGRVNEDLEAVTSHLAARGFVTPRLVRTDDGAAFVPDADDRPWRVITYVEGRSFDTAEGPNRVREAGRLVGRFHAVVADMKWEYRHVRPGVHDTAAHMRKLVSALDMYGAHRLYDAAARTADPLLAALDALAPLDDLPRRHAHGDLKLSNLLFDTEERGLCLVDLDTLGRMAWPHEMGDALRSWCNPVGEDSGDNSIDPLLFTAAVQGYADSARSIISGEERALLVTGVQTICLELAARFLTDALEESYFGWNPDRYGSRGEHNLARARGQLSLGLSVAEQRAVLESAVTQAFLG